MTQNSERQKLIDASYQRLTRRARYSNEARESLLRVKDFIASHERKDGEGNAIGGTGATVLKFEQSPIARLCNSGNLGNEEMQAVEDITTAFHFIAGGLLIKPIEMQRMDRSHSEHTPERLVAAERRYKSWANHWSARSRRGDKLLQIVIAAVIDECPLYVIEAEIGIRKGKAKAALIAGLRDYAARAGWAEGSSATRWIDTAEGVFTLRATIT